LKDFLVVLNKDEDTVSFISAISGETVTKIEVDHNPHEVVISPCGKKTYITCSLGNRVNIIDNEKMELKTSLSHPEFEFPHGIALSSTGHRLFITATFAHKIFIIDTTSEEVIKVLPTYQKNSHMIATTPEADIMFIPNIGSDNVTVFLPREEKIANHFPTGAEPEGIAVHPKTLDLYVANQKDNTLYCVDTEHYRIKHKLLLGTCPIRVVISPDGRYCLVPNRESDDLSIIDTSFPRKDRIRPWEIKRIPLGIWPGGTVFNPEGTRAFAANNKTNDISVINMETLKEEKRYQAGIHPDGLAYLRL